VAGKSGEKHPKKGAWPDKQGLTGSGVKGRGTSRRKKKRERKVTARRERKTVVRKVPPTRKKKNALLSWEHTWGGKRFIRKRGST